MSKDIMIQVTLIKDDGDAELILSPAENLMQVLIPEEINPNLNKQNIDCASEKVFWKYARCILYLNLWLSQFRLLIYILIGLVRFICCDLKKVKAAAIEVLKSALVAVSAMAAIYVTEDLVHISHCIGEVIFEFLIGGLTLQICLGLGDAFIHTLFGCTTIDCTVHKVVESILEPLVFIGGFFSIFVYCKSDKGSKEAKHAKYSALGNFIGSSIATVLAIYLCFRIEEEATTETLARNDRFQFDFHNQLDPNENEWGDFNGVKELYDTKNAILATNIMARIFAEGIAKCVEHKCIIRRLPPPRGIAI